MCKVDMEGFIARERERERVCQWSTPRSHVYHFFFFGALMSI